MLIKANFSQVEALGNTSRLVPGTYEGIITAVNINDTSNKDNQMMSICVTAGESAGEQVGSVAYASSVIYDKGTKNYAERFLKWIKSIGIAIDWNHLEADQQIEFDTDELKGQVVKIKVGIKKAYTNKAGEYISGLTEIKAFLLPDDEVDGPEAMHELDSTFASSDVLDKPKKTKPKKKKVKAVKEDDDLPWEDEDEDEKIVKPKKKKAIKSEAKAKPEEKPEEVPAPIQDENDDDNLSEDDIDSLLENI